MPVSNQVAIAAALRQIAELEQRVAALEASVSPPVYGRDFVDRMPKGFTVHPDDADRVIGEHDGIRMVRCEKPMWMPWYWR